MTTKLPRPAPVSRSDAEQWLEDVCAALRMDTADRELAAVAIMVCDQFDLPVPEEVRRVLQNH
jgi:hypothetical protein